MFSNLILRVPRRVGPEELVTLDLFFGRDPSGLAEVYEALPIEAQAELQCRVYRREPTARAESARVREARALAAGFRVANEIALGDFSFDSIVQIHSAIFPEFKGSRLRDESLFICVDRLAKASPYYRDNYRALGRPVRLTPEAIERLPEACPHTRWRPLDVRALPLCLGAELPEKPGERWITVSLPNHSDVPLALTRWLEKLNAGPRGPTAGWAGRIFSELCEIHPLIDGNGRVGGVIFNSLLKRAGFPFPSLPSPDVAIPFPPRDVEDFDRAVTAGFTRFVNALLEVTLQLHAAGHEFPARPSSQNFWETWASFQR